MLTPQSRNLLGVLSLTNSEGGIFPKPQTPDCRCRVHRLLRNHLGCPRTLDVALARHHF
jgi:hypothetical protein